MPCTYYPTDSELENLKHNMDKSIKSRDKEINTLTRLLCEAMGIIDSAKDLRSVCSGDLEKWWLDHQIRDIKRLAAEKEAARSLAEKKAKEQRIILLQDQGRAKLTPEERDALGI